MQVLVDIPKSLSKFLEYVPEEDLPVVIIQALEDKIKNNIPKVDDTQAKLDDILSVLSDIKSGAPVVVQEHPSLSKALQVNESQDAQVTTETVESYEPQNIVEFKKVAFEDDDDDDDLFDDLMK